MGTCAHDITYGIILIRLSLEKRVELAEKGLKKVNIGIENLKLDIERQDGQNDYTKSWYGNNRISAI